jgi:serine protease Do
MTKSVAASLGFVIPYGAIFETPKPDGPAAPAGIEAGDVVTTINGIPLSKSRNFEGVIARFAPGSVIHLTTLRDCEPFDRTITLDSARCPGGLSVSNLAAS